MNEKASNNTTVKTYNSAYDFYIDEENGVYSKQENNESYTFAVYNDKGNEKIKNVVFNKTTDGSYDAIIADYNITETELPNLTAEKVKNTSVKYTDITMAKMAAAELVCIEAQEWQQVENNQGNLVGGSPVFTWQWVTTGSYCFWVGGANSGGGGGSDSGNSGTGNSGTSGGGSGSPRPVIITTPIANQYIYTINPKNAESNYLNLTGNQVNWLNNQPIEVRKDFLTYFTEENNNEVNASNSVSYLISNPNATFLQYINWFSISKPGVENDEVCDETYWDNPNLVFPQQTLPTFAVFNTNFPSSSIKAKDLCTTIGGEISTLYDKIIKRGDDMNTCAIRLSLALNNCGYTLPNIPNKTKLGSDGKYYFTFALDINNWMIKTFGTNSNTHLGPLNAQHKRIYYNHLQQFINPKNGNVLSPNNPLTGLQGIYSLISNDPSWSTGHCDVIRTPTSCKNNCHFEGPIKYIDIWVLN